MDQKVTNQAVLGELDARGIKFLTLRMRSVALQRHIAAIVPGAWRTVALDRDGAYRRPQVVDEETTLSAYPGTVRQLIVTGLGREAATVIITNDRAATAKQIIERYARRMNIEQRLAESIRSFHLDSLAGAVAPQRRPRRRAHRARRRGVRLTAPATHRLPPRHPPTPSSDGSSPPPVASSTTASPSPCGSSDAPTPRSYAKPTSQKSPSPGGAAARSASSSNDQKLRSNTLRENWR